MGAGRPIKRRTNFANDVKGLNNLRTALVLEKNKGRLDKEEVAKAIISLDALVSQLAEFDAILTGAAA